MRFDCIGFGALNIDNLHRVECIAKGGEESIVTGHEVHPGGSAANTMVALARLGNRVGFLGKVAEDEGGSLLLRDFIEEGVDTRGIVVSKTGVSGQVMGFVDKRGERALYVEPGVNDTFEFDEIDLEYASSSRLLHLTSFVGEQPLLSQQKVVESLTSGRISFDPGMLHASRGLVKMRPILRRSYVAFPNALELKLLTGQDPQKGSKTLIAEGVQIVAVKLGDRGCYVTDGDAEYWIEAFPVRAVDTTGAGDAFCAGFLHGLISGKGLEACGRLGNFVASKKVAMTGARDGLPRREDLDL